MPLPDNKQGPTSRSFKAGSYADTRLEGTRGFKIKLRDQTHSDATGSSGLCGQKEAKDKRCSLGGKFGRDFSGGSVHGILVFGHFLSLNNL